MASRNVRSFLVRAFPASLLAAGLVACVDAPIARAPLAVQTSGLGVCSGGDGLTVGELSSVEVVVQDLDGTKTYGQTGSVSGLSVGVGGVPEGLGQTVTLTGFKGETAHYFGRRYDVPVEKGRDNPVQLALSKFGGFSCPTSTDTFTHRLLPTATPMGGGYFLVAGGFTRSSGTGAVTFSVGEAGASAFIYDSLTGALVPTRNSLRAARGAHAAVLVRGTGKSQVVLFGGASALEFDPASANGFGWDFKPENALSSIEVFEWTTNASPIETGTFLAEVDGQSMRAPRVFPTAATVSSDGLVIVCDGGQWTTGSSDAHSECDVFDTPTYAFLPNSKNFPLQHRAGGAVAQYGTGSDGVKLLFVGGSRARELELYRASSAQRAGSGGTFVYADNGYDAAGLVYFPSLTALGENRFAMIGGVKWNGERFEEPSANNAVLLTIQENGSATYVTDDGLPAFEVGRYFHAAAAPAGNRLAIIGGFTSGTSLAPTDSIRLLDITRVREKGNPVVTNYNGFVGGGSSEVFAAARGGVASVLLDNDTILIAGGASSAEDLAADAPGSIDVYTPSHLRPIVLPIEVQN